MFRREQLYGVPMETKSHMKSLSETTLLRNQLMRIISFDRPTELCIRDFEGEQLYERSGSIHRCQLAPQMQEPVKIQDRGLRQTPGLLNAC